ncbi:hypothetical protein [Larkinella terrae]|uniref:Uncharacterized protein n=1 Tax=Larkinella terrae TaxID=2025311 RepID=A0A7K0ENF6_9BACT|nr:hypothetical protein [Larkinella terrae]MRS63373.1 hypothetical protein [Larkinella terrae]
MEKQTNVEKLKIEFEQIKNYEDRITFCLENFHPGPCENTAPGVCTYLFQNIENEDVKNCAVSSLPFHPSGLTDWPLFISTMPQTPEEWQLNNQLFYEYVEKTWFTEKKAEAANKAYTHRKAQFCKRIANTIDHDEILKEEIENVINQYEQPGIVLDEMFIHFNLQIKTFRERRRGIVLMFPKEQDKWFSSFGSLMKIIEADQAYRYYTYLRKLQQTHNWVQTLRAKAYEETSYCLDKEFIKSYDSQFLTDQIKEEGYFPINSFGNHVRVYLGPLAAFLISENAKVKNSETQAIETVNGTQFIECYVTGFKKGAEYFDSRYRVPPSILFGPEAKEFGDGLHFQYYHSKKRLGGWNYWRKWTPRIINYESVNQYGYYAGIISRFEDMACEYPDYFKKYVFPSCKPSKDETEEENEKIGGKVVAEIVVPGFDDPAKMQRGITSLVHQFNIHKGQPIPYLHPFLWHTKFRHPNSSEYTLEVNNDEIITDDAGNVTERRKVPMTDKDIDEAFITFITSCHTNQIVPFLTFQFEKYYNKLKAKESAQPFFDHVIKLADLAINRGILYKTEMDAFSRWITNNPHYNHNPINSSAENKTISTIAANQYSSFSDLFFDKQEIGVCVDALRKIGQPVIGAGVHWIGRKGSKSILVAWIDRLEYCNKIRIVSDRRQLVPLLNAYFPNLNFGAEGRQFGEKNAIYDRFRIEFASLILP